MYLLLVSVLVLIYFKSSSGSMPPDRSLRQNVVKTMFPKTLGLERVPNANVEQDGRKTVPFTF